MPDADEFLSVIGALAIRFYGQLLSRANASADKKFQLLSSLTAIDISTRFRHEEEMKTCPVCALDVDDAFLFCPDDGSSLEVPTGPIVCEPTTALKPDDDKAVVLYCPACSAEYPLTFAVCPVHGARLTTRRSPELSHAGSQGLRGVPVEAPTSVSQFRRTQSQQRLTTLGLRRPEIERPQAVSAPGSTGDYPEPQPESTARPESAASAASTAAPSISAIAASGVMFEYLSDVTDGHERGFERRGLRIAAIATMMGLVVFGLMVVYTFVSNFSRRPAASTVQIASTTRSALDPAPFVPTPQEAQDYKEEDASPSPPSATSAVPQQERPTDRTRNERLLSVGVQSAPKTPVAQPLSKAPARSTAVTATPTRVSNPPLPALPRGDSGGFDARLVRVRSRQTAEGFRYDLTFNMQEQAGRAAQWQRVLVNTRSASGMNHSEAIPFAHRLGASGALTFTISVELTGRSQADWQGRIVCTTLGWDNKGAPLQASFGANVTP